MWRWWKNKKNKWKDRLTSSQLTKVQRCRYEWLLMPVGWSGEVSRPQHFPQNQVVLFLQSSIFFHDRFFFFIENPKTLRVLHYSEMEDMDSTAISQARVWVPRVLNIKQVRWPWLWIFPCKLTSNQIIFLHDHLFTAGKANCSSAYSTGTYIPVVPNHKI